MRRSQLGRCTCGQRTILLPTHDILRQADIIVADSIPQCLERGEIHKSIQSGDITKDEILELGNMVSGKTPTRTSDTQITVADLTGVAVQDIKIAGAVYSAVTDD